MSPAMKRGALMPQAVVKHYGALPWRVNGGGYLEVLLLCPRPDGRWTVATVRETGTLTPLQAAERAAFGEAGVIGRLGPEPIGRYRCDTGGPEMRSVTVFGLHVCGTLVSWPQEKLRHRRWWPIGEACGLAGEPGLAELLGSLTSRSSPEQLARGAGRAEPAGCRR